MRFDQFERAVMPVTCIWETFDLNLRQDSEKLFFSMMLNL
jgi:hypothetical protein